MNRARILFTSKSRPCSSLESFMTLRIVIIGNGVAGTTCALAARRRDPDASITIIGGETPFFFSRTALMYAFMERMTRRELEPYERDVYRRMRIELVHDWVREIDLASRVVHTETRQKLPYDRLVLALGSKPRALDCVGVDEVRSGLVNFVSMQDLDACEGSVPRAKHAVVVGGGLIGIELVECLRHHRVPTTFLLRDPYYWPAALGPEEAALVDKEFRRIGVDVRYGETITAIDTDSDGAVRSVDTTAGDTLACDLLGVCVGVEPRLELLRSGDAGVEVLTGIVVDETFLTSAPDVFAIGDCAEIRRRDGTSQIETLWYSAKRHASLVGAHNLFGDGLFDAPPVFYNSSKFVNLEYTTVGDLHDHARGAPSILFEDTRRAMTIRIVHDGDVFLGLTAVGSRWDHELLQRWVQQRRSASFVEQNLASASFDVEFGRPAWRRLKRREFSPSATWTG